MASKLWRLLVLAALIAGYSAMTASSVSSTAYCPTAPSILHITNIDTAGSVERALQQLGYSYDLISGSSDWTGIDFTPYSIVIAGIDGGPVGTASIQKVRTDVIDAGKRLIFLGGTCLDTFAIAVNDYLIDNDITNYCWAVSKAPHWTITDPAHPLAYLLPSPYTYATSAAAYYQIRAGGPNIETVAINGDGYPVFFRRTAFPGAAPGFGDFTWYVDSPRGSYWSAPADFEFFKQLLGNAISAAEVIHRVCLPLIVR